jgi:WD40 repeat protein
LAATGLDYRLLVWDTYTGELLQDVAVPTDIPPETLFNGPKHFAVPPSVSFSSDGRWLSLSKNPTYIFDTETWEVEHTIKGIVAAFVHEPNQIVAFAGSEGMLFDAETGQKIQTIKSEAAVREISVAANAKRMCTVHSTFGSREGGAPEYQLDRSKSEREATRLLQQQRRSRSEECRQSTSAYYAGRAQWLRARRSIPPQ